MPERLLQLKDWLGHECGLAEFRLEPASGDASFRRYFRVFLDDGATRIAMDAPPDKEDCAPFVQVDQAMADAGVHVPAIYHQDLAQGFLLLEDLGDRLYLDELSEETADRLYGDAMSTLLTLQVRGPREGLPPYDRVLLENEMELFREWLLGHHLDISLSDREQATLDQVFAQLATAALQQPQVCVHRDYHSRNLLVNPPHSPGVIDFQDAVIGPVTYDLVSLLRDCYIRWPLERVDDWAMGHFKRCVDSGVLQAGDETDFLRWFDLMGAQRHFKAAGIFARLNHRDGKPGYLGDIPRTLGYILEVAERRPELQELAGFISQRVLPGLDKDAA